MFALFVVSDPFGLASSTSSISEQMVYRAYSLLFPRGDRDRTAIVVIDDASAASINGERGHPLTFAQHASILRPILCAGPAAVLLDITFRGLRTDRPAVAGQIDEGLQKLIDVLGRGTDMEREFCRRTAPAVTDPPPAVYIARTRSHPPSPCDALFGLQLSEACTVGRQLDQLARVATPVSVAPVPPDGAYPLLVQDEGQVQRERSRLSPAVALVATYCQRLAPADRLAIPGCRDDSWLKTLSSASQDDPPKMYPLWPYFLSAALVADELALGGRASESAPQRKAQARYDSGLFDKLGILTTELWHSLIQPEDGGEGRLFGSGVAFPLDTFTALDVSRMATRCGDGSECERRLRTFFAGRIVVYGLDITGVNDKVKSPVLGAVPGAAYHATVAENLLWRGKDYLRPSPILHVAGLHLSAGEMVDIVAFGGALIITSYLTNVALKSVSFWRLSVLLPWFGVALSLAVAATQGLAPGRVAVGVGLLLLALFVMLRALTRPPDKGERPGATAIARGGRYLIGISVALPLLIAIALACFWFLHFPPTNLIGTLLIYSDVADEEA